MKQKIYELQMNAEEQDILGSALDAWLRDSEKCLLDDMHGVDRDERLLQLRHHCVINEMLIKVESLK